MINNPVSSVTFRYTHLDSLRAALMFLGVVLHAGFVYINNQTWLIASTNVSRFFDYLVLSIHTFRMPAFFLLSGFLFSLTLSRSEPLPFFRSRSRRILVPLFTAGLILNLIQFLAFNSVNTESHLFTINSPECGSITDIVDGCWTIHLWFLVNLFYYFLIGWPITRILAITPHFKIPGPGSYFWPLSIAIVVIMGQFTLTFHYRGVFDFVAYFPLIQEDGKFIMYFPFFLIGAILSFCRENPSNWRRINVVSVLFFIVSWVMFIYPFDPINDSIAHYYIKDRYHAWLFFAVAFQTTAFLVVLAARLPKPSISLSAYLSDLALSIYLIHHILVFSLAAVLIRTGINIGFQFIVLVTLATILSWAFHHYIIRESGVVKYLFNGRLARRSSHIYVES